MLVKMVLDLERYIPRHELFSSAYVGSLQPDCLTQVPQTLLLYRFDFCTQKLFFDKAIA